MTMLRKVLDFVYLLPFLFSLYQWLKQAGTFYDSPYLSLVTYVLAQSNNDVEWCSIFHYLLLTSIWLHKFGLIYYRLFSIKYKYHVVAVLYSQSCICLHLDKSQIPLFLCPAWALCSHLNHWSLYHWNLAFTETLILLTPSLQEPSSSWQ